MKFRHTKLIFFFVFCANCILMTWSASDEGDQNRSWGKFLNLGTSGKEKDKGNEDTKGKGIAFEGNSAEAGTSTKERPTEFIHYTNEGIDDILRFKYTHRKMGLNKKNSRQIDWQKISAAWSAKHGDVGAKTLCVYVSSLRRKMFEAANKFDNQHPDEPDIVWTDRLNENLIRTYYLTEEGEASEHGQRMLAEWIRWMFPGYQNLKAEYLFNRAKAMLRRVMKITPADMNSEALVPRPRQPLILRKDHEDFLEELWKKYPCRTKYRKEKIVNDAVAEFGELEAVGKTRLYRHAKYLHYKNEGPGETSGSKEEKTVKKRSWGSMKKNPFIWKTEHDEVLESLWEGEKKKGPKNERLKRFHQSAVQRFPDLDDLTPGQLYDRMKYIKKRKSKDQQA